MALYAKWVCDDDAANTTVVESGGNYNGTFNDAGGDPNTDAHTTTSGGHTGLIFDGGDDYFTAGNTTDLKFMHGALDTTGFTWSVAFWYKLPTPEPGKRMGVLSTAQMSYNQSGFNVFFNDDAGVMAGDRMIAIGIWRSVAAQAVIYGGINQAYPNDTDWHHVVVTYDQALPSANAKIYVDSVYKGTVDKTGNTPSTANSFMALNVGEGTTFFLDGTLSDIRIYDTVLSADDVLSLYGVNLGTSGGSVTIGPGSIGTRFIHKDYPYEEGLTAGTTKQTGSPILKPTEGQPW